MTFNKNVKVIFVILILITFFLHLACSKKNALASESSEENNNINNNLFITPIPGTYNDSISITISNKINVDPNYIKVFFESSTHKIQDSLDRSSIKIKMNPYVISFKLPPTLTMDAYTIQIVYNKNQDKLTYNGYAILDTESIKNVVVLTGINPSEVNIATNPDTKITVTGKNFSSESLENKIMFLKNHEIVDSLENIEVNATATALTFSIPEKVILEAKDTTIYDIKVIVKNKNSDNTPSLPLTIINSAYPTFYNVEIKSSDDNKTQGTSFEPNENWHPDNVEIYKDDHTLISNKKVILSSDDKRMYFPADIDCGKYYIKVSQKGRNITAIHQHTKDSIIIVKPYITELSSSHKNATDYDENTMKEITVQGANLTKDNSKKVAFSLTTSDGHPSVENTNITNATKLEYPHFSKGLPAGNITISNNNGSVEFKKEINTTFAFYKPIIESVSIHTNNKLTIKGAGFSKTSDTVILSRNGTDYPLYSIHTSTAKELMLTIPNDVPEGTYHVKVNVNGISSNNDKTFTISPNGLPVVSEIQTFYIDGKYIKINFLGENMPSKIEFLNEHNVTIPTPNDSIGFDSWQAINPNIGTLVLKQPTNTSNKNIAGKRTQFKLTNVNGSITKPFACLKNALLTWTGGSSYTLHSLYLKNPNCYLVFFGDNLFKDNLPHSNKIEITYTIIDELEENIIYDNNTCTFRAGQYTNSALIGANTQISVVAKPGYEFEKLLEAGKKYKFVCHIENKADVYGYSYKVTLPFFIIP